MTNRRTWTLVVLLAALSSGGCGPPQIGEAREAFKAVDALYTAVSLRDVARVDHCEAALRGLRDAGKLPAGAADRLVAISTEARAGQWEPAQLRLRDFMVGQRR